MRKHFMFKVLLTLVVGLFLSVGAFAQQITVNGIVKDTTGEPVIGANVLVKGTTNGTITDFDGNFQLMANQGDIIVISFIGYTSQELPATGELMNVILKDDSEMLNEVVVIGYGVAKKNDLTGSVTAVKPDEMNKGLVTNAQDMMQGKIAGVNVTSASGTPGAGATIRIRGGSSLNASNDPLIVIDGLAMDNNGVKGLSNPLSMVNPADIESFTVLKDASATAIYGSRGSNGVIIITTKKGRSGSKPSVAYNGNVSVSMKKKTIDVMDGDQYREFITNMYGVDSPAYAALGTANTDWQSEIYRAAISTDHNVTISGGLKNMPYRVSIGYTNQQGILKTSDFQRYTASVNLSPSFFDDHLKVNLNAKGMIAKTSYANTEAVGAAVWMDPTQSIRDDRPQFNNFGGYFQWLGSGAALNDPTWDKTYNSLATKNPVALLEQQDKNADSKTFIGNAEFDYKVHGFEDLRLHMNLGGDFSKGEETTIITPQSSTNAYYGWDGWDKSEKYNLMFNAYAQYMKDFNDAHHFDIMGGYEWQHFHQEGSYDGFGLYPSTNTEKPGQQTEHKLTEWKTENYLVSFFGRANYSLLDRYLLTATVRYDGSSRFK
ncbi:MAG: SusC/RagA family TonB-linked outer membrane protein, partial [Bacteroidaceae bacterium]|nr:SusC/RagA family TonB-linked outer membrane protein [Bacteroidaceae bacterium]